MNARRHRSGRRTCARGRTVALLASVAIHAGVLGLLALKADAGAAPRRTDAVLAHLILPEGTLVPAPIGAGPLPPRALAAGNRPLPIGCRGTVYTGIGARVNGAGFIVDLAAGGPAERAGLLIGDIIVRAAEGAAANLRELRQALAAHVGKTVALAVLRGGAPLALQASVGEWPGERRCH